MSEEPGSPPPWDRRRSERRPGKVLRDVIVLGLKELRVLLRDRQAAALLFVMPGIFVFLLSLAVGDIYEKKTRGGMTVAFALDDTGEHGERFKQSLGEGNFDLVEFPEGLSSDEVFKQGIARATVRIPAGFSDRIETLIGEGALDGGLGDERVLWAISPKADAVSRAIVRVSLTLSTIQVLQHRLSGGTQELVGELGNMASEVSRLVDLLESAAGQLQSTKNQLSGDVEDRIAFGMAAEAEKGMAEQAAAAREALEAAGDGGALVHSTVEGDGLDVDSTPVGVDTDSIEVLNDEQRAELDSLLARTQGPAETMLTSMPSELGEDDLIVMGKNEEGVVPIPNPVQQNVPGWSLFAMFFIVVPMSSLLHRERVEGTTRRLLALGVPRLTILLGKLWPFVFVGALQFVAMTLVGMYLVPLLAKGISLELGSNPITLVPLTLTCAFAATSYSLLVATMSRTSEQAAAFGASSVVVLAALGGVMIPHFMMPPVLQTLAKASPFYWGHQAYLDVFLQGASVREIAQPLLILGGIGVLCLAASARRAVA